MSKSQGSKATSKSHRFDLEAPARSIGKRPTMVTYLEMLHAPATSLSSAHILPHHHEQVEVVLVDTIDLDLYRYLYDGVGKNWDWTARKLLTNDQLRNVIHRQDIPIYIMAVDGAIAGFVELDCRNPDDIEIVYFGIVPEFYGRRLGLYLLWWTVKMVWIEWRPQRFWVHTCDLDHPSALHTYKEVGFRSYTQKQEWVDLIEE